MLNEVLQMLEANDFFVMLGEMKSREFVATLVEMADWKSARPGAWEELFRGFLPEPADRR